MPRMRPGDQPLPVPNGSPDVQSMVIADIEKRREVGIERYGTALQPHNGRDAMRDLYEELIDACQYVRQVIAERDAASADGPDDMYERAYWDVQRVLDEALGIEEQDGSEGGIAADVALLAGRCKAAEAEVMRLRGVQVLPGMPGAEL